MLRRNSLFRKGRVSTKQPLQNYFSAPNGVSCYTEALRSRLGQYQITKSQHLYLRNTCRHQGRQIKRRGFECARRYWAFSTRRSFNLPHSSIAALKVLLTRSAKHLTKYCNEGDSGRVSDYLLFEGLFCRHKEKLVPIRSRIMHLLCPQAQDHDSTPATSSTPLVVPPSCSLQTQGVAKSPPHHLVRASAPGVSAIQTVTAPDS